MHLKKSVRIITVVVLFALVTVGAQRPSTPTAPGGPSGINRPAGRRAEPCWEQAGISKSVIEQRRSIQENTRSQIQAVCNEPNLSQQQKREKIRQIHQAAHEQVNALISPAERQKLEACQRGRGSHIGGVHAGGHARGSDPCAGIGR